MLDSAHYAKLDNALTRRAEAATEAADTLNSLGEYAQAASLLRSLGAPESLIYDTARGFAAERGEEEDFMEDLYGDLLRDPS